MKQSHRFGFYFSGFAIGIVFLIFFLSGKKTSCSYFPNSRVLSDIQHKKKNYSPAALRFFNEKKLDTANMIDYLEGADINFGESQTDLKPCPIYQINSDSKAGNFHFVIKNCVDFAEIQEVGSSEVNE
jgi:hypothetical protein